MSHRSYDARNRRVGRQDGTGPWKQYTFTPTGTPLAELTRPTTSGGAWSLQREYVWLDGRPLAQIEYPGPAGGSEGYVYLVHVDHLGQPRALTTRANTTVWAASAPRPYGDMDEAMTVDPASNRVVFTNLRLPGQYDERLLGAISLKGPYYNHHRWYLPSLARYMELDPIALRGGLNGRFAPDWYGYASANPISWIDPLGLQYLDLNLAAGFIVGLTGGVVLDLDSGAFRLYGGGGVMTPGIGFSFTHSDGTPTYGWNLGLQVQAVGAIQAGYSFSPDGGFFTEWGGGWAPGASLTGYWVGNERYPFWDPPSRMCKP